MPLVSQILGVWKFEKPPFYYAEGKSLPDNMIHFLDHGSYTLTAKNNTYHVKPGFLMYYRGSEDVSWRADETPVVFYSIGFVSPALSVPQEQSVLKCSDTVSAAIRQMYLHYQEPQSCAQQLLLWSGLFYIISFILRPEKYNLYAYSPQNRQRENCWPGIEYQIKINKNYHQKVNELPRQFKIHHAKITRDCKKSSGTSPLKRLKLIRLEESKKLLMYSNISITEIADYLKYQRLHDFSREFSRQYRISPTQFRKTHHELTKK